MTLGAASLAIVDTIVAVCEKHGHDSIVLLSGVAGTGKTTLALAAAQKMTGSSVFVRQIQFHQSYSYEDFIEGLRPNSTGGFESRDGVFTSWNAQALDDPNNRYVLLIEEFTRANISAVLGELMTYIEYRDRTFQTPVTNQRIRVARNLVILGTMNPRDRSALELDEALIRRLRLIDCPPDANQLREMLEGTVPATLIAKLQTLFAEVRDKHGKTYSTFMPFGHGIFAGVTSAADLDALWDQKIRYLLYRPSAPPHPYAADIEALYPRSSAQATAPAEAQPATVNATLA